VDELERHLSTLNARMAFCHNDLLIHNIIFDSDKGIAVVLFESRSVLL